MRYALFMLFAILLCCYCHLEKTDAAPIYTFETILNQGQPSHGISVCEDPDGNFYVGGSQLSYSDPSPIVIHVSKVGQTDWKKVILDNGITHGSQVLNDGVGGVYLSQNGPADMSITRLDEIGEVVQNINSSLPNTVFSVPLSRFQSDLLHNDTRLIICGSRQIDLQWDIQVASSTFGGTSPQANNYGGSGVEEAYDILETTDGNYVICGYTGSYGDGGDAFFIKIKPNGTLIWEKNYGGTGKELVKNVVQTPDKGFLLCGYSDSYGDGQEIYFIKTDASGEEEWHKTIGGAGDQQANCLIEMEDGQYLICGTVDAGTGTDLFLAKLSPECNAIWTRTYGKENYDSGEDAIQTSDKGYLIVGRSGNLIYLVKTDQNGEVR